MSSRPAVTTEVDTTGDVLIVDPAGAPGPVVAATVADHLKGHGSVWVDDPPAGTDEGLAAVRLVPARDVLRLERALPIGGEPIDTRAFVPGQDEEAWVAVNNRAFSGHREQGSWTVQRVVDLEDEPWFDPAGFLLHERDGRLAGFCWTKVHRDLDPPAGEIFVIAVDPDFSGLGLGRRLTAAGLHHLAGSGLTRALLYVDAANDTARAMYARLGFVEAARRRLYLPAGTDGRDGPPAEGSPPGDPDARPSGERR